MGQLSRRSLEKVKSKEETLPVYDLNNSVSFTQIVQIENTLDWEPENEVIISHIKELARY